MEAEDKLNFEANSGFIKKLGPQEHIVFSTTIVKYNKRNKAQERKLVVTNKFVYNVKSKSNIARKIELAKILGITKSVCSSEFVIHCPDEYDYHFSSPDKDRAVDVICSLH
jgi:serum/glucocorticoid-regulated kinase 2